MEIALFRVTSFSFVGSSGSGRRSVHMSFWAADGSAILVSNLNGKPVERINVQRIGTTITQLSFDKSATLGLGRGMTVLEEATFFEGNNAWGNPMIGEIINDYDVADLSDTTPKGFCKENGCDADAENGGAGGRANNVPICPIPSFNDLLYIILGGGGLLVADLKATPMAIVGEYGRDIVYGAGCAGAQVGDTMFMDSGISAAPTGFDQSYFAVWAFDDVGFPTPSEAGNLPENFPAAQVVYADQNDGERFDDGQIPGDTVRRDSHGAVITTNGLYLHVVDRIQNVVEVFNTKNLKQKSTYDLTFSKGPGGTDELGACDAASVTDYAIANDPSPDLLEATPDGKYLMAAFRGPAPVSVPHSAQGSCPGVGVIELEQNGKFGRVVAVLRATNTISDKIATISPPSGVEYSGLERADVHGCIVIAK